MWNKLKSIVGTFAPIVATALGSPIAGVAISGICKILGLNEKDNPLEEDIILALKGASSESILAIQKLGMELQ